MYLWCRRWRRRSWVLGGLGGRLVVLLGNVQCCLHRCGMRYGLLLLLFLFTLLGLQSMVLALMHLGVVRAEEVVLARMVLCMRQRQCTCKLRRVREESGVEGARVPSLREVERSSILFVQWRNL